MIWALNIGNLVLCHLLSSADLHSKLLGGALADLGGLLPWQLPFKVCVLRMLSYSLDLHRARTGRGGSNGADIPTSSSVGDLKVRLNTSQALKASPV